MAAAAVTATAVAAAAVAATAVAAAAAAGGGGSCGGASGCGCGCVPFRVVGVWMFGRVWGEKESDRRIDDHTRPLPQLVRAVKAAYGFR